MPSKKIKIKKKGLKPSDNFLSLFKKAEDGSVVIDVIGCDECESQLGDGFEELINFLNKNAIKINKINILPATFLNRFFDLDYLKYNDANVKTPWELSNQKALNKLSVKFDIISWAQQVSNEKLQKEWIKKIESDFEGWTEKCVIDNSENKNEKNSILSTNDNFRNIVIKIAKKKVMRLLNTPEILKSQNSLFVLKKNGNKKENFFDVVDNINGKEGKHEKKYLFLVNEHLSLLKKRAEKIKQALDSQKEFNIDIKKLPVDKVQKEARECFSTFLKLEKEMLKDEKIDVSVDVIDEYVALAFRASILYVLEESAHACCYLKNTKIPHPMNFNEAIKFVDKKYKLNIEHLSYRISQEAQHINRLIKQEKQEKSYSFDFYKKKRENKKKIILLNYDSSGSDNDSDSDKENYDNENKKKVKVSVVMFKVSGYSKDVKSTLNDAVYNFFGSDHRNNDEQDETFNHQPSGTDYDSN